jgi:hypothetical protein
MGFEDRNGAGIEGEAAAPALRLRLGEGELPPTLRQRAHHRQSAGIEVQVLPAQTEHFTASQAGGAEKPPGGVQAIVLDRTED